MKNEPHLSASERKLRALAQHVAELETSRQEFHLFLNLVVHEKGGEWIIPKTELKKLNLRPIKSVISDDGETITMTFQSNNSGNNSESSLVQ